MPHPCPHHCPPERGGALIGAALIASAVAGSVFLAAEADVLLIILGAGAALGLAVVVLLAVPWRMRRFAPVLIRAYNRPEVTYTARAEVQRTRTPVAAPVTVRRVIRGEVESKSNVKP
jgi:hypothetical protein